MTELKRTLTPQTSIRAFRARVQSFFFSNSPVPLPYLLRTIPLFSIYHSDHGAAMEALITLGVCGRLVHWRSRRLSI